MYNTCFWALVLHGGRSAQEANKELSVRFPPPLSFLQPSLSLPLERALTRRTNEQGTISSQKQELLFSTFGINYNNLPPMFRKGSVLVWEEEEEEEDSPTPPSPPEETVRPPPLSTRSLADDPASTRLRKRAPPPMVVSFATRSLSRRPNRNQERRSARLSWCMRI